MQFCLNFALFPIYICIFSFLENPENVLYFLFHQNSFQEDPESDLESIKLINPQTMKPFG